jgi:1-acyl-sn-glycerol-3-phosphate acyltransferase
MHISPRGISHDLRTNLKPRELFYWSIGNLVYWGFHAGMRVELYGVAEHYGPPAPATLILGAHKRDWDPIMFAAYGYYYRGWLAPDSWRRHAFAGRADVWETGFLATVIGYKNWPLWMQWLLDHVSFAPIANRMRGYPILRVPEYTLREYLRSVLKDEGDLPLSSVLSEETIHSVARVDERLRRSKKGHPSAEQRPQRISDILGWEYRLITSRRVHAGSLAAGRYERLREHLRALVDQQLEALARAMDSGDTLWFAPEGAVTLDGKIMRLRGGLQTLLARARPDVRVLPSTVTYDFMTSQRRMIACLAVGPELKGLRDLDRSELSQRVTPALARQITVTMSQLGSARLLAHLAEQRPQFQPETELPILAAEARRLASLGAWVQRDLLTERGLRRRLRAFLAYGVKQQVLLPQQDGGYLVVASKLQGIRSSTFWENPVRYCANELSALEEALSMQKQDIDEAVKV